MSGNFQEVFPRTKTLLESARGDGTFPAYAAAVFHDGQTHTGNAGCGTKSLFDLASLTKVLCTGTLAAMAEARGVLDLSQPLTHFFPAFADTRVRLSHLLDHSAGFPDWLPLHAEFHPETGRGTFNPKLTPRQARETYEQRILASHKPEHFEQKAVYSDLGFMLLGWILEKAAGTSLDAIFQEWIAQPFGLTSLQFLPIDPDVVPTEDCPWRGHVLHGEVHDDNCYVLGGVAGHAGLFGNVHDVLKLGVLWLDAATGRETDKPLLPAPVAARFFTFTHVKGSCRSLAWDGVSPVGSSTGQFFSRASRGHLGYTGTSLWIDPEKNLVVALLTNRVHPTRNNTKIKAFRPVFHDTVLTELGANNSGPKHA